ncbi:MAG: AI-2E family transporter [Rhodobacterales bacterium]|mgnify:FL=1|nr:AI-2E family transporter [Rhodobacterales bacterium]
MRSILKENVFWVFICMTLGAFLLWNISDILAPFILGGILAYLLDPMADKMESFGVPRLLTALTVSLFALFVLMTAAILVIPIIFDQINQIIGFIPYITNEIYLVMQKGFKVLNLGEVEDIDLVNLSKNLNEVSPIFAKSIFNSSFAILDFIFLLMVTPIVAIYLLVDWDKIIKEVEKVIPRRLEPTISQIVIEMHKTVASFLRGQFSVCIILAIFYAASLTALGLEYGLLVGLFSGLISFIPLIGAILGGLVALVVSLAQFWQTPEWVGVVLIIFLFGQVLEGNLLTPRLVGKSVKLHPLWIIFSVTCFGSLMGWVGVILAVPSAACIAVLVRFSLKIYFETDFYKS